jgi:tetratricopeptide (TPR) repeat protein
VDPTNIAFLVYAALFRLTIIAAGFGCVFLGYRLFVLGVMPQKGSDLEGKAGEIRLTLKNAAPGTCFTALGVLMIVVMLLQGNPERTISEDNTETSHTRSVTMRGEDTKVADALSRGRILEQKNELDKAIRTYASTLENGNLTLLEAAGPLRAIAGVYYKQDRFDEALAYASLAYQVDPDNAAGLALLARIQWRRERFDDAIKAMAAAAKIDITLIPELHRMKGERP